MSRLFLENRIWQRWSGSRWLDFLKCVVNRNLRRNMKILRAVKEFGLSFVRYYILMTYDLLKGKVDSFRQNITLFPFDAKCCVLSTNRHNI